MKSCGNCVHSRTRPAARRIPSDDGIRLTCTLFPPVAMLVAHERKGIETAFGFPVVLADMLCGQWLPAPGHDEQGEPIKEEPQAAPMKFIV